MVLHPDLPERLHNSQGPTQQCCYVFSVEDRESNSFEGLGLDRSLAESLPNLTRQSPFRQPDKHEIYSPGAAAKT